MTGANAFFRAFSSAFATLPRRTWRSRRTRQRLDHLQWLASTDLDHALSLATARRRIRHFISMVGAKLDS